MIFYNRGRRKLILPVCLVVTSFSLTAFAQETAEREPETHAAISAPIDPLVKTVPVPEPPDKRVFGVLPNYRTANYSEVYTPITTRHKFFIAGRDSFDYPLVILAGGLAGLGQLGDQNPAFGQGVAGFARRLGTSYADQAIGNMLTEGLFPAFLHEDPRYFRRGFGTKKSRFGYALTRVFVTRTDAGGTRFNFSEVLGNAAGVAISNSYYSEGRTVSNNLAKLSEQISTDAISQVLKEFWPDIKRKLFHHKREAPPELGSALH